MAASDKNSQSSEIQINMLGGFSISCNGNSIGESTGRTRRLWNLLGYLIANREESFSQAELIEAMWPDSESENPSNALKNLVYRIRNLLSKNGITSARDLIVLRKGCYSWNSDLQCTVDFEQFEQLGSSASCELLTEQERIRRYRKALDLYKGDFMSPLSCELWVIPLANHYRSLYFRFVEEAGALLIKHSRFGELCDICKRALAVDPYNENIHMLMIYSLANQGRNKEALIHYRNVTDLFYSELGIQPSKKMRDMYTSIVRFEHSIETDIEAVKNELCERDTNGAFYCEYEVFKNMYRLEARIASRCGQSVFIGLLTILDENDSTPSADLLCAQMGKLLEVIRSSLRKGDVVSRFSASQYVVMLPTLTYENGEMVMKRICKRFSGLNRGRQTHISYSLKPLDPAV